MNLEKSELDVSIFGEKFYNYSREPDNEVFKTKSDATVITLEDKAGDSFDNAVLYLNKMQNFIKNHPIVYDREDEACQINQCSEV